MVFNRISNNLTRLYELFPLRAPSSNSSELEEIIVYFDRVKAGKGISATQQTIIQLMSILTTILMSVGTGLITGLIITYKGFDTKSIDQVYSDAIDWVIPQREHVHIGSDRHCESIWITKDDCINSAKKSGHRYRSMSDSGFP